MGALRRALRMMCATGCTAAVAVFGVAGCSSDNGSSSTTGSGSGSGTGEANITMTSFPDYVDPQLSYTVEGWEVLYNTYTPLLTYKHAKGEAGAEVVPGLAKDMPEVSADGKTYKLTLRPNMKYSDGTPIKASDFTYAIQRLFKADSGGSVFYKTIVGASDYADGKAPTISGITTDDATGAITIQLEEANGTFENLLGADLRRPGAAEHPAGLRRHQQAAGIQWAVHDHQSRSAADSYDGTQPELPNRQGRRRHRSRRRAC